MDPAILLIIVFIVAPLIERLLKAGKDAKQPPPPQQRGPLPRPQEQRPAQQREQGSPEPPVIVARREEESAATMLPDDLWEILTGQTRMPESPPRIPEPEEPYGAGEDVSWDEIGEDEIGEDEIGEEEIGADPPVPARWRSAELEPSPEEFTRPLPARQPTRVVSMEKLEFDGENRHAQFHDKLERTRAPIAQRKRAAKVYRFTGTEDVRRAIVLREILGPPKGLE